ncbi:MAG: peptide deformylase [Gammaproteobacteria bacterium]|nr:peptide deformylase [Gammaproteobacteria bacterium]
MSKWEKLGLFSICSFVLISLYYIYSLAETNKTSSIKLQEWNKQMQLVTINTPDQTILRQPAQQVIFPVDEKIKKFMDEMAVFFSHLESPYGKPAGLAAPQIHVPLSIIILQIPPEAKQVRQDVFDTLPPTFLINPSYVPLLAEGKTKDWEGCYSVPERMGEVYRYRAIQYEAYTVDGIKITGIARGFLARLIQHEVGHLNGELYTDLLGVDSRYGAVNEMMAIRKRELNNTA